MDENTPLTDNQENLGQELFLQAALVSRAMLASRLGMQFGGNRDLYASFGYIQNPTVQDYKPLFERQGLATRAVEKFGNDTWNQPAILIDGDSRSDTLEEDTSQFIRDWVDLTERIKVWQVLRQADVMCGYGRYSVIFLGAPGASYADPAGNKVLSYISAYDEGQAQIASYIQDIKSPEYGMPEFYTVSFNSDGTMLENPGGSRVHYTRTIHVAEDKIGSRVFGRPRLQRIINRLFDLEKVTGGGAEAAWLAVFKGMLFLAKDGAQLPAKGTEAANYLDEQINKLMHRIQRYATLEDVEVHDMGVQEVNIRNIFDVLTDDLAGSLGIPKRILFGSERGELASSQDKVEWNGVINSRRTNFAEPEILRPFIKWCIAHKVIAAPSSKRFSVEWADVYPMTKSEKAEYSLKLAQGASAVTGGVPEMAYDINEWRNDNDMAPRTEEELEEYEQEQEEKEAQAQGLGGGAPANPQGEQLPDQPQGPTDEEEISDAYFDPDEFQESRQQAGRFLTTNFEGHRGRPGKVGGSLPRSAGTGPTPKMELERRRKIVNSISKRFGFDEGKISYEDKSGKKFKVGGIKFDMVAEYVTETGEVRFYGADLTDAELKGVAAHEFMHGKFDEFINALGEEEWAEEIFDRHIGSKFDELVKTDGVTDYSSAYWKKAKKGGSPDIGDIDTLDAITETLSEIGRLEYEDPDKYKSVSPAWKNLYNEMAKRR